MGNKIVAHLVLILMIILTIANGQTTPPQTNQGGFPYPPSMPEANIESYKTIGDVKLNMYIFNPAGHKAGAKAPAVVFFFGGGWSTGSPQQFEQQCRYLASRGMVAMAADYRVATRHNVTRVECVKDAKSAIRWVRQNANRLGVDPDRITAGGGSAGGHLAAATGLIPAFDESSESTSISSRPNAMVLFNPAVVLEPDPQSISPYHYILPGAPATVIFHGKADTTVPYATVELFTQAMIKAGNRCELNGYEGQIHGFFNFGRDGNKAFLDTVRKMDRFLASLGYVKGDPTVDVFQWGGARNHPLLQ